MQVHAGSEVRLKSCNVRVLRLEPFKLGSGSTLRDVPASTKLEIWTWERSEGNEVRLGMFLIETCIWTLGLAGNVGNWVNPTSFRSKDVRVETAAKEGIEVSKGAFMIWMAKPELDAQAPSRLVSCGMDTADQCLRDGEDGNADT